MKNHSVQFDIKNQDYQLIVNSIGTLNTYPIEK